MGGAQRWLQSAQLALPVQAPLERADVVAATGNALRVVAAAVAAGDPNPGAHVAVLAVHNDPTCLTGTGALPVGRRWKLCCGSASSWLGTHRWCALRQAMQSRRCNASLWQRLRCSRTACRCTRCSCRPAEVPPLCMLLHVMKHAQYQLAVPLPLATCRSSLLQRWPHGNTCGLL